MYYSKSKNGFYPTKNYENSPSDLVEITAEEHNELLVGQSNGLQITTDDQGKPILVDPRDLMTMGDRRLNQRNILKSARESYIESALNGFQVRQQDRDRITRTANRWDEGGFGESRDWIMADNSVQQVTKADLQDVLDAYDLREIEAFGIFNQLCADLENSDEPESITWPY